MRITNLVVVDVTAAKVHYYWLRIPPYLNILCVWKNLQPGNNQPEKTNDSLHDVEELFFIYLLRIRNEERLHKRKAFGLTSTQPPPPHQALFLTLTSVDSPSHTSFHTWQLQDTTSQPIYHILVSLTPQGQGTVLNSKQTVSREDCRMVQPFLLFYRPV